MELLLNSVWTLVASAAFTLWVSRDRNGIGAERSSSRGLLVLACVVMLLFPVISMTDDMQLEQFAMCDTAANAQRVLSAADQNRSLLHGAALIAIASLFSYESPGWHVLGLVAHERPLKFHSVPIALSSGRAPPFVS
jgi:hypothetical protein